MADDDVDQDALAAEWGAEGDDEGEGEGEGGDSDANPNLFSTRKRLTACSASSSIMIVKATSAVFGQSSNPALFPMNACRC